MHLKSLLTGTALTLIATVSSAAPLSINSDTTVPAGSYDRWSVANAKVDSTGPVTIATNTLDNSIYAYNSEIDFRNYVLTITSSASGLGNAPISLNGSKLYLGAGSSITATNNGGINGAGNLIWASGVTIDVSHTAIEVQNSDLVIENTTLLAGGGSGIIATDTNVDLADSYVSGAVGILFRNDAGKDLSVNGTTVIGTEGTFNAGGIIITNTGSSGTTEIKDSKIIAEGHGIDVSSTTDVYISGTEIESIRYGIQSISAGNLQILDSTVYGQLIAIKANSQTGQILLQNVDMSSDLIGFETQYGETDIRGSTVVAQSGINMSANGALLVKVNISASSINATNNAILSQGTSNEIAVSDTTVTADTIMLASATSTVASFSDSTLTAGRHLVELTGGNSTTVRFDNVSASSSLNGAFVNYTTGTFNLDVRESDVTSAAYILQSSGALQFDAYRSTFISSGQGFELNANSNLNINGSYIEAKDRLFSISGTSAVSIYTDSSVIKATTPYGNALNVSSPSASVEWNLKNTTVEGHLYAMPGAATDVVLNDSSLTGQVNGVSNLSLTNNSTWYLPDDENRAQSNISNNLTNNAAIVFPSGLFASSGLFSSIDVAGNFTGNGALHMNTDLGALQGDRITVSGNTAGTQTVYVSNTGAAPSAHTGNGQTDGLKLIEVQGNSAGTFQLGSPVVVGIYDYTLSRADGQSWYLQSFIQPVPPVPPAPRPTPEDPDPTPPAPEPRPHVVDTISGYLTVPDVASRMVLHSLANARNGSVANDHDAGSHSWQIWSKGSGYAGSYGDAYSHETSGLIGQVGADYIVRNMAVAGDRTQIGAWVGYGSSHTDLKRTTAKFDLDGPQIGAYVIYNQDGRQGRWGRGLSIDAMAVYSWLDADLSAKAISGHTIRAKYDADSWGLSAEAGYGIAVDNRTILRPIVGLTYTQVDTASVVDSANMSVRSASNGSWIYNAGLRLEYQLAGDSRTTVWMLGGAEYDTATTVKIVANDIALQNNDSKGLRGVIGAGIKGYIGKDTEIFASSTVTSGRNFEYEVRGSLGLRTRF